MKHKDGVKRVRIFVEEGVYFIQQQRRFQSMKSLLVYYTAFPIALETQNGEKYYIYAKRPIAIPSQEHLGYVSFVPADGNPTGKFSESMVY